MVAIGWMVVPFAKEQFELVKGKIIKLVWDMLDMKDL